MFSRILKLSISTAFFGVESMIGSARTLLGEPRSVTCVVLYYHSISDKQRARFARQMDLLLRCADAVSASAALPTRGKHFAVVTFDDGFQSVIRNALPELEKRGIPATLFIVADCLGKVPTWGNEQAQAVPNEKVMSMEQLRSLPALVTIGSHSLTHPNLCRIDEQQARGEIFESRRKLKEILGTEVKLFSFPYGSFNTSLVEYCREAGYSRVFTTLPSLAFTGSDHFVTGRVPVDPTDWPLEFKLKVRGAYRWLPLAFLVKRRLKAAVSLVPRSPSKASEPAKPRTYAPNGR